MLLLLSHDERLRHNHIREQHYIPLDSTLVMTNKLKEKNDIHSLSQLNFILWVLKQLEVAKTIRRQSKCAQEQ